MPMTPKALVPLAHVRNVRRAVEFYRKLGFEEGNIHTPEGQAERVRPSRSGPGSSQAVRN